MRYVETGWESADQADGREEWQTLSMNADTCVHDDVGQFAGLEGTR